MQGKNASRNDRLKAALRDNLRRRKVQARARQDDVPHEAASDPEVEPGARSDRPPREET